MSRETGNGSRQESDEDECWRELHSAPKLLHHRTRSTVPVIGRLTNADVPAFTLSGAEGPTS